MELILENDAEIDSCDKEGVNCRYTTFDNKLYIMLVLIQPMWQTYLDITD